VPLDRIGAHKVDMKLLHSLPLKCTCCGGREVELWLFVKCDEAEAWVIHSRRLANAPDCL
jgi:hypothetical protein